MLRMQTAGRKGLSQTVQMIILLGIGVVTGSLMTGLLTTPSALYAQTSSPLTIQPDTGRVGIGTVSPGFKLHVSGVAGPDIAEFETTGVTSRIFLDATGAGGRRWGIESTSGLFNIVDSTINSNRFSIAPSGNVGIGTIAPAQRLDVGGNMNVSGAYYQGGAAGVTTVWPTGHAACGVDTHLEFRGGILVAIQTHSHGSCG